MMRSDERAKKIRYIVNVLESRYHSADLGNRKDPVEELVFISLTRQTHMKNALKGWTAITAAGGVSAITDMPPDELETLLKPTGFARQKATWIRQSLAKIAEAFGELSLEDLQSANDSEVERFLTSLPGVSIKTAKCIMLYTMGRNVLPVDIHLRRIASRIGLVKRRLSERQIHTRLEQLVEPTDRYSLHVNAIWHGRQVCVALKPKCASCDLLGLCRTGQRKMLKRSAQAI